MKDATLLRTGLEEHQISRISRHVTAAVNDALSWALLAAEDPDQEAIIRRVGERVGVFNQ